MDIQEVKKYLNNILQEPQDTYTDAFQNARKDLARTILGMLDCSGCKYVEKLEALEAGGVDNWEWYSESLKEWNEKWNND